MSVSVLAQSSDTAKRDTIVKIISCFGSNGLPMPLYVIDGLPLADSVAEKWIKNIDPNTILGIDVLKKDKFSQLSEAHTRDVVVVTTKAFAVQHYKKKFSAFSADYRKYLDDHLNDDARLNYLKNGKLYKRDNNMIKSFYDLPQDSIKKISFLKKHDSKGIIIGTVIIETK